jgi:hypothetical protein
VFIGFRCTNNYCTHRDNNTTITLHAQLVQKAPPSYSVLLFTTLSFRAAQWRLLAASLRLGRARDSNYGFSWPNSHARWSAGLSPVLLPIHIISFHIVWDLHIQNPSVFSDQCACRIIIIVEIWWDFSSSSSFTISPSWWCGWAAVLLLRTTTFSFSAGLLVQAAGRYGSGQCRVVSTSYPC